MSAPRNTRFTRATKVKASKVSKKSPKRGDKDTDMLAILRAISKDVSDIKSDAIDTKNEEAAIRESSSEEEISFKAQSYILDPALHASRPREHIGSRRRSLSSPPRSVRNELRHQQPTRTESLDHRSAQHKRIDKGMNYISTTSVKFPDPSVWIHRKEKSAKAEFGNLTLAEYCYGSVVDIMRADSESCDVLLSHLLAVMLQASNSEWSRVRQLQASIKHACDLGLLSLEDKIAMSDFKSDYALQNESSVSKFSAKVMKPQVAKSYPFDRPSRLPYSMRNSAAVKQAGKKICLDFNKGTCSLKDHHDSFIHACAGCLETHNKVFIHPDHNCQCNSSSA